MIFLEGVLRCGTGQGVFFSRNAVALEREIGILGKGGENVKIEVIRREGNVGRIFFDCLALYAWLLLYFCFSDS